MFFVQKLCHHCPLQTSKKLTASLLRRKTNGIHTILVHTSHHSSSLWTCATGLSLRSLHAADFSCFQHFSSVDIFLTARMRGKWIGVNKWNFSRVYTLLFLNDLFIEFGRFISLIIGEESPEKKPGDIPSLQTPVSLSTAQQRAINVEVEVKKLLLPAIREHIARTKVLM